uniref:Uncharacterized protein n=1 Tax=viral metagenome TaxID=1070528 RepID=A0A6M3M140_9ZZZZ
MIRLPKLPEPPGPEEIFSLVNKAGNAIETGLNIIDKVAGKFDQAAQKFGPPEPTTPATVPETAKEPSLGQDEMSSTSVAAGTACLPCSRDHLSTSSSALSEAIRFARDKGVKDPEAVRRIRIALDELNIMERIDLAPDETTKLKGAEKELATWTLKQSRELRHAITAIKDIETMELAAVKASAATEEFMSRLMSIPEKECETCGGIRESIRQFVEKRKRERGEEGIAWQGLKP